MTQNNHVPKAFLTGLSLVSRDSRKAKQFLTDKRLTQQEKMVLAGFLSLRDFENQEVVNALSKISCENQFVESQRLYCLGCACNNLTLFHEGREFMERSIELNTYDFGLNQRLCTLYSLFTLYFNHQNITGMENVLAEQIRSGANDYTIFYSEFSLHIVKSEITIAEGMIPQLEKFLSVMNEHQEISFYYDLVNIYVQTEKYAQALLAIERIKRVKKFKNAPQVKFMIAIVNTLKERKPIYLYEKDFEEYPETLYQLKFLQALECGDKAAADDYWNKLREVHAEAFAEPYNYLGRPDLFSKLLSVLLMPRQEAVQIKVEGNSGEDKLVSLLSNLEPLRKDAIYEVIYGKPVETKDDLKKLVKIVQRARDKYQIEIKSIKGSYQLILSDQKAS